MNDVKGWVRFPSIKKEPQRRKLWENRYVKEDIHGELLRITLSAINILEGGETANHRKNTQTLNVLLIMTEGICPNRERKISYRFRSHMFLLVVLMVMMVVMMAVMLLLYP